MPDICAELIISFVAAIATIAIFLLPFVLFELYLHTFLSHGKLMRYIDNTAGLERVLESRGFAVLMYLAILILSAVYFIYYKQNGLGEITTWIVETQYILSYFTF